MSDEDDGLTRISLRMPRALHERLAAAAKATSKSMNAEIVARLTQTFGTSVPSQEAADLTLELLNMARLFATKQTLLEESLAVADRHITQLREVGEVLASQFTDRAQAGGSREKLSQISAESSVADPGQHALSPAEPPTVTEMPPRTSPKSGRD